MVSDSFTETDRYGAGVDNAGVRAKLNERRIVPPGWFNAEQLALPIFMIYEGTRFERDIEDGERRLGTYILPPFQRPAVWTQAQQIRFIESLWTGLPVGAYVFNMHPHYKRVPPHGWLLDGQQRLTAILAYVGDEFPVFGFRWSELTIVDHRSFGNRPFPAYRTNTDDIAACAEIYDRLAYGGTAHEPKALLTPEPSHD